MTLTEQDFDFEGMPSTEGSILAHRLRPPKTETAFDKVLSHVKVTGVVLLCCWLGIVALQATVPKFLLDVTLPWLTPMVFTFAVACSRLPTKSSNERLSWDRRNPHSNGVPR